MDRTSALMDRPNSLSSVAAWGTPGGCLKACNMTAATCLDIGIDDSMDDILDVVRIKR